MESKEQTQPKATKGRRETLMHHVENKEILGSAKEKNQEYLDKK
jgi:hypothetical protein